MKASLQEKKREIAANISATNKTTENPLQKRTDLPYSNHVFTNAGDPFETVDHKSKQKGNYHISPVQKKENKTGLPDQLKQGVERLSGVTLDDVRVNYNSDQPRKLNALAYAQGSDIHMGPGQERHLPHETWHVAQQKQGRVQPTTKMAGMPVNDNAALENEADAMGAKAMQFRVAPDLMSITHPLIGIAGSKSDTIQRLGFLAGSDAGLAAQYTILLGSAAFRKLNTAATTTTNIRLIDSSAFADPHPQYDPATHSIQVPVNQPDGTPRALTAVRENLVWEMHNATAKGAHKKSGMLPGALDLPLGASEVEKKKHVYQKAAFALAMEWDEWMNVAEHVIKVGQINADAGMAAHGAGPHVANQFGGSYNHFDAGWFLFSNYLRDQIAGHTIHYDANAALPDWKGKAMLNLASAKSKANLVITEKQHKDFLSGKTTKMKSASNNPFKSDSFIAQAMR